MIAHESINSPIPLNFPTDVRSWGAFYFWSFTKK